MKRSLMCSILLLLASCCWLLGTAAAETRVTLFDGDTSGSLTSTGTATSNHLDCAGLTASGLPIAYHLVVTGSGRVNLSYTTGPAPNTGTYNAPALDGGALLNGKAAGTYSGTFTIIPGDKIKFTITEIGGATAKAWLDIVYY